MNYGLKITVKKWCIFRMDQSVVVEAVAARDPCVAAADPEGFSCVS